MYWFFILLISVSSQAKEISLSFDDAPRGDGEYFTGAQRAQKIVSELKKANVEQVIFYANPGKITDFEKKNRLHFYKRSGHLIGNHTFDHISADKNSASIFLDNINLAGDYLKSEQLFSPYFRFPYLHRGKTLPKINQIRIGIEKLGYVDGYVTIDNFDYYMDKLFQKALIGNKKINLDNLRAFYVETLMKSINFYDGLAQKFLGRSPKHVLLLHENDLAALFIGDLVQRLKQDGWRIITPVQAYTDEDLSLFPNVLLQNQGRVAAKARENGFQGVLSSGFEDEKVLEELFNSYNAASE